MDKQVQEILDIVLKDAWDTSPADHKVAEDTIADFYDWKGLKRPTFVWVASPHSALEYIKKHKYPECGPMFGQHYDYWNGAARYVAATKHSYGTDIDRRLAWWPKLAESCGWWFPYEFLCICCEKMSEAHWEVREDRRVPHNDSGPAILYADGWSIWALHGTLVPEELVMTPAEKLNPAKLATYTNAEVRKEFVKKIGVGRLESMGKLIDENKGSLRSIATGGIVQKKGSGSRYSDYKLIDMAKVIDSEADSDFYAPYLFMTCISDGERHAEGVHEDCHTVEDALNWRMHNKTAKWQPDVLT